MGSGGNLPVGPGFWGFVAFFVLAVALWLLVRNMNGRLRRMAYREREGDGKGDLGGADRDTTLPEPPDDAAGPAEDDSGRGPRT